MAVLPTWHPIHRCVFSLLLTMGTGTRAWEAPGGADLRTAALRGTKSLTTILCPCTVLMIVDGSVKMGQPLNYIISKAASGISGFRNSSKSDYANALLPRWLMRSRLARQIFVPLPPNLWVISKANSLSLVTEVRRKDFFRLLKVVHDGPLREWA